MQVETIKFPNRELLIKELQRLYSRAAEGSYTVKEVKDSLAMLGVTPEGNKPIMEQIRKLVAGGLK